MVFESAPALGGEVLFPLRPHFTVVGTGICLGPAVKIHVHAGCRAPAVDFGQPGRNHFQIDLAFPRKDLRQDAAVAVERKLLLLMRGMRTVSCSARRG